jgi:hypothetical protein
MRVKNEFLHQKKFLSRRAALSVLSNPNLDFGRDKAVFSLIAILSPSRDISAKSPRVLKIFGIDGDRKIAAFFRVVARVFRAKN